MCPAGMADFNGVLTGGLHKQEGVLYKCARSSCGGVTGGDCTLFYIGSIQIPLAPARWWSKVRWSEIKDIGSISESQG